MKSIITLLSFVFLSASLYADNIQSRLIITNLESTTLRIIIDGRHYEGVGSSLALNNLAPGFHQVRVYQVRKGWLRNDRLIYSSKVFLKPNYQVNVLINRSGQVSVVEKQYGRYGRGNDRNYGKNDSRYGNPVYDNRKDYRGDRY